MDLGRSERESEEQRTADEHAYGVRREWMRPRETLRDDTRLSCGRRVEEDRDEVDRCHARAELLPEYQGDAGQRDERADDRAGTKTLEAVEHREPEREERDGGEDDRRCSGIHLLQTEVRERIAEPEVDEAPEHRADERGAVGHRDAPDHHHDEQQQRRRQEADRRTPVRRELGVAEAHRDEVRSADEDDPEERRERGVLQTRARLGARGHLSQTRSPKKKSWPCATVRVVCVVTSRTKKPPVPT